MALFSTRACRWPYSQPQIHCSTLDLLPTLVGGGCLGTGEDSREDSGAFDGKRRWRGGRAAEPNTCTPALSPSHLPLPSNPGIDPKHAWRKNDPWMKQGLRVLVLAWVQIRAQTRVLSPRITVTTNFSILPGSCWHADSICQLRCVSLWYWQLQ